MKATIKGTALYLNGDAPKGPFEMVLLRQGDEITGRWSYAGESGKLTGKVGKLRSPRLDEPFESAG